MKLNILSEALEAAPSYSSNRFNGYLLNNNPITAPKREYYLEVEGLPYSFEGHKDHDKWIKFLEAHPHLISNSDTRYGEMLDFMFQRWKKKQTNS